MIEIEVVVDGFTGRITDSLVIAVKKGDKLIISEDAWEVIQTKYKKWFKFCQEIKKEPKKEVFKDEDKAMEFSPSDKMIKRYGKK